MAGRSKRSSRPVNSEKAKLLSRICELELRVKILEARVRTGLVQGRRPQEEARARSALARRSRPRPRCPGCTLELPAGPRGESCVWCGFQFDAVAGTFPR
jgi:hypothetical protein